VTVTPPRVARDAPARPLATASPPLAARQPSQEGTGPAQEPSPEPIQGPAQPPAGAPAPPAASPLPAISIQLALAAVAGLGVRHLLPPGDPLAGTLALLPLLLAALHGIHRWGVHAGGRRLSRGGSAGELAALGLLLAAALDRAALDLPYLDELLAGGLLLVLAHRLARQLLALRPLLGTHLGRHPPALFFWLPLTVYLAILPWSVGHRQPDGDEPYNLLLTHSLAYDGDTDLANNYAAGDWRHFMDRPLAPQPGDPVGPHGELYSRHNALLPLALVPAYRLAGKTGVQISMAALTAALAWLTLRLGRHYAAQRPGEALVAYAWMTLGPPLLLYSYQVWVEVPAALLSMMALDALLDLGAPAAPHAEGRPQRTSVERRGGGSSTAAPGNEGAVFKILGFGIPILLLPLLKIRFILIAAPLMALTGWRAWRYPHLRRRVLALGFLLLVLVAGILLYNQRLYSNPLKIHDLGEIDPNRHALADYLGGCVGLFYDAAFGLFGFAPIWLLLLPAMALLLARRQPLPVHLAVFALPYLLIVAPRGEWYGGWSPPFRYALITLPLLALGLVPLLASRRRPGARALIAGLGALTLALSLLWVIVPGWTYNFADGRTYVLDNLASRLAADVARFFPSAVRPRAATWIWPPVSCALVVAAWWLPLPSGLGRRRPGRSLPLRSTAHRGAALLGVAAVLLAAAALPIAAQRLPTRVVELEDPQVHKLGGQLYPDRWVNDRTRFRGGWVLRVGERLEAPVIPGGSRVRLTLAAELVRNQPLPFEVDLAAGDRLLAVWTPVRDRAWEEITVGPFDWPAGAPLVLTARGPAWPGAPNGAVLDRVELAWE
jgi:hypothetical protein